MTNIGQRLKLKYGLCKEPTSDQIENFYRLTKILMALKRGESEQKARSVAKNIFEDYETSINESNADTIEMLLKLIEENLR